MLKRLREGLGFKDQSSKLADIALKDDVAAFDLISSLGSADEGVREVAFKAILEVARKNVEKLLDLVMRWSGDRYYKMNAFLKWTDGLESKFLDRIRSAIIEKLKSGNEVDHLVNEYDAIHEKIHRLKDYYAQKRVTQQAYDTLLAEYESQLLAATKKLLEQFLENARNIEELSQRRDEIRDQISISETKAVLGDMSRKESITKSAELNKQLEEIKEKDKKLSEELSVMLMLYGPIKIHDENYKNIAIASEFSADRDRHVVELKARLLTEEDVQISQMGENKNEFIAYIHNLTNRTGQAEPVTADKITPQMVEEVSGIIASELKISSDEARHPEKMRFFLEMISWRSGKARKISIPTRELSAFEKGFMVKPGSIEIERIHIPALKPVPPTTVQKPPQAPQPPTSPEKAIEKPRPAVPEPEKMPVGQRKEYAEVKAGEGLPDLTDQELQTEIKSLQEMIGEDKPVKKKDKALEDVDSKVLSEVDKAAEKLKERMKK